VAAVSNALGVSQPQGVDKIGEAASTSEVPTGLAYYTVQAQKIMQKMEKVVNGPVIDPTHPDYNGPSNDPMDSSMITR